MGRVRNSVSALWRARCESVAIRAVCRCQLTKASSRSFISIMYDLKTATRLYVLDGHKHKVTACSFSPDGRRLYVFFGLSTVLVSTLMQSHPSSGSPSRSKRARSSSGRRACRSAVSSTSAFLLAKEDQRRGIRTRRMTSTSALKVRFVPSPSLSPECSRHPDVLSVLQAT